MIKHWLHNFTSFFVQYFNILYRLSIDFLAFIPLAFGEWQPKKIHSKKNILPTIPTKPTIHFDLKK